MTELRSIDKNSYIGDSLPLINLNYSNLDSWTADLQFSATNRWTPLVDLYHNKISEWQNSTSLANTNSALWLEMCTTVEAYSSKWIQPLTLIYPGIFYVNTEKPSVTKYVSEWLNSNYAVLPDNSSVPSYVENQTCFVYNYYRTISKTLSASETILAETVCSTFRGTARAQCSDIFSGVAHCKDKDKVCDGYVATREVTQPVDCYFDDPYIISTALSTSTTTLKDVVVLDVENNPILASEEIPYENIVHATFDSFLSSPLFELKDVPLHTSTLSFVVSSLSAVHIPKSKKTKTITVTSLSTVEIYNRQVALGVISAFLSIEYQDKRELTDLEVLKFKVQDCQWVLEKSINPVSDDIQNAIVHSVREEPTESLQIISTTPEASRIFYVNNNGALTVRLTGTSGTWFTLTLDGLNSVTVLDTAPSNQSWSNLDARSHILYITNNSTGVTKMVTVLVGYQEDTLLTYKNSVYKTGATIQL